MMDKNDVIAVVMGGPSAEREISLATGAAVAEALRVKGYRVTEIDLDPKKLVAHLEQCEAKVVFNAVHGLYGEDGRLQTLLEMIEMPYTGSGLLASVLGLDKAASKRIMIAEGIPTPKSLIFARGEECDYRAEILRVLKKLPVVIKPSTQGSSIGVVIVKNEADIADVMAKSFEYSREVVVEEFIGGKELTVAIMQDGDKVVALPVINIVPHSGVYDFHSKYTKGETEYLVPAPLEEATTKHVQELAIATYKLLGCSGVARVDVMLDESGQGYVLEVNTVPGMTATSLVPKAAAAVGISFPDLCEKIVLSASFGDK